MKNILIAIIIFSAFIATSCQTEKLAPELSVSVNPAQIDSMMHDTIVVDLNQPIEFQLSGNPYIVTFFSGETSHIYANRNRIKAEEMPKLDFNYNAKYVKTDSKVDVLVSTDFSGHYDSISIRAASWDSITPLDMKTYLNTDAPKAISTLDLSNYSGNPVFLAFRLIISSATRVSQPSFSALLVRNYQSDGTASAVVDGVNAAGMSFVTLSENGAWKLNYGLSAGTVGTTYWKVNNSNTLQISTAVFNPPSNTDGKKHEIWAISKVIYLDSTMPDVGVSAKNLFEPVSNYKYTYTKTGVYTVTFVASNTDRTGVVGSTIKELTVKVK